MRWLLVVLLCFLSVTGVSASVSSLTWDALKTVQAIERVQMTTAQSEQLLQALEVQKKEIDLFVHWSGTYAVTQELLISLADKHTAERKEIIKTFAEERVALAKTQSDERKAFLTSSK